MTLDEILSYAYHAVINPTVLKDMILTWVEENESGYLPDEEALGKEK